MNIAGAYDADRAAALSGVPRSTIHYWARKEYLIPSVSRERVKLWSYTDLLALRTIDWLRRTKRTVDGREVSRTTLRAVRHALHELARLDLDLFDAGRPQIAVSLDGELHITPPSGRAVTLAGQTIVPGAIDLIAPFEATEGTRGPDLREPSMFARILPRRLSGAPHVIDTRIETQAIFALAERGFEPQKIVALYPELTGAAVRDVIDLERRLLENLRPAA